MDPCAVEKPKIPDYYADLELHHHADAAEVKRAFMRLAKHYHPDRFAPGESVDAHEFRKVSQ